MPPRLTRAGREPIQLPRCECQFHQEAPVQEMGRPLSHTATTNTLEAVHVLNPPPQVRGRKFPPYPN